jgi:hypothetical protein
MTIHAHHGARIACASGADRYKVEMQLRQTGLMQYFEGRIFSGYETPRSKPFPDVYLAAAAALQVLPAPLCRRRGHRDRCVRRRGCWCLSVYRLCTRRAMVLRCSAAGASCIFQRHGRTAGPVALNLFSESRSMPVLESPN